MIEVNKTGEVWIFAEQSKGQLQDTPLELLSKGRELADQLGVKLAAVLLGDDVSRLSGKLGQFGADKVYLAQDPLLEHYQANSFSKVIYDLIHKHKPQIMLYGVGHTAISCFTRFATSRATRNIAATSCSSTSMSPSYSARLRFRCAWSSTRHCS
jgi:electron transfer flavoprotein alpha subunit